MRIRVLWLILPLFLAACGAVSKWAPDDEVARAKYSPGGPATLTLFTVISNRSNSGAHLGLMINGSQRVLFDPAGTWWSPSVPERNDVHYGITDRVLEYYIDYHTRETYRTVIQTIEVSPEVAEMAIREVQAYGAVPKAFCTKSITAILVKLPGFENVKSSFFPKNMMRQFRQFPGVTERVVYDDDADDNTALLVAQQSN